jgi:hypothetical protein
MALSLPLVTPFKDAIKTFLHHQPILSRRLRSGPVSLRLVSLGLMTGLGWMLFTSVELKSAPSPASQGTLQAHLVDSAVASVAVNAVASSQTLAAVGEPSGQLSGQPSGAPSNGPQPFQLAQADTARLSGNSIRLNSQNVPGRWQQKNGRIGVSSSALAGVLGAELLSTTDPAQQPIRWFPASEDEVVTLPAWWDATDRYVDISDLASRAGWSVQASGGTLQMTLPPSQVSGIRQGKQTWGDRIVIDLSGPATWQMESSSVYTITIAGEITPQQVRAFRQSSANLITQLNVAAASGRTVLKIKTQEGASPQIWSTGNPARVVIDVRRDAMIERDVAWAPGLRWRQQYVSVGSARFPVYMFLAQPNPDSLAMRPIHAKPNSAIGIEPILAQAQRQQVTGAVNAGFFNRNNQLPLGAVRNAGQWISGPILGRGAMAWNERGDLIMDRYALAESVRMESGETLPLLTLNSGYVQAGISRYTAGWGATYTPVVDNEIVVTVQGDRVTAKQPLGKAGAGSISIPGDGYLLALRSSSGAAEKFAPGVQVTLQSQSQPAAFEQYPNIVGGGPLLIRSSNIVLNAQQEGFSTNFIQGAAPRTAVGKTADGTWIIATMHERVGGRGPTLAETAQIMQQLGAVDALNLDGGSSSSFYLGGQLLNRQPSTAARVNNGIGLFVIGGE